MVAESVYVMHYMRVALREARDSRLDNSTTSKHPFRERCEYFLQGTSSSLPKIASHVTMRVSER